MNLIGKALWYIESHFADDISLDDVAVATGLSKFHLARTFNVVTGMSVMRFVRARRLGEAAKRLVGSSCSILDIALDSGYNSHEAFTRAFHAQFGMTPDGLRKAGNLENINIVEPIPMSETLTEKSGEYRIVDGGVYQIVGLKKRYSNETSAEIPAQWQSFQSFIGNIANQRGNAAYGVLCNSDDKGNIDYITGVEVGDFSDVPKELDSIRIPPQTYMVFRHHGHVSEIRNSWKSIFGKWLPETDYKMTDAPQFERYGEDFDPDKGTGLIEIWIPVRK